MSSIKERAIDVVAEQLGVEKEKITREKNFVIDLGADSLDTVELVMEIEEEFDINIPEDAAEKITTVGELIDYLTRIFPEPVECQSVKSTELIEQRTLETQITRIGAWRQGLPGNITEGVTSHPSQSTKTGYSNDTLQFVANAIARKSKLSVSEIRGLIEKGTGTFEEFGVTSDMNLGELLLAVVKFASN